jgi:hypothetical protein
MGSIYFFIKDKYFLSGFLSYLSYSFRPSLLLVAPLLIIYKLYKGDRINVIKLGTGFIIGMSLFVLSDITGLTAPAGNQPQNILVAIQSYGYNINHSFSNFTEEQIGNPVKTYLTFMITHPLVYIEQRLLSLWSLWGPYVPSEYGIIGMILHGLRFPFFVGAVTVFIFRKKFGEMKDSIIILFIPVLSVTVLQMLFFSTQRHQFPAEPFVIILSILGIEYFLSVKKSKFIVKVTQ